MPLAVVFDVKAFVDVNMSNLFSNKASSGAKFIRDRHFGWISTIKSVVYIMVCLVIFTPILNGCIPYKNSLFNE